MTTVINGSSPSITFSDNTTQSTAALPLTGGTVTGGVNLATSSGNVGIGTTTPANKFAVSNSGAMGLEIVPTGGVTSAPAFYSYNRSGAAWSPLTYYANYHVFGVNGTTEAMRIDSSGNVGIGTATPGYTAANRVSVQANGASSAIFSLAYGGTNAGYFYADSANTIIWSEGSRNLLLGTASAGPIQFTTNNTERMRIESGGNVNIGLTSGGAKLNIKTVTSDSSTYPLITVNSSNQNIFYCRSDGYVAAEKVYGSWTTANAASVWMDTGGGLYRSTSSIKYKKNVVDTDKGLADVLKLRAVLYEGKSEVDAGKQFGGLIAEEVHDSGLTEFVQYGDDGSPEGLNYGPMVSLAFKAIQELKAELDATKAEIALLKAK